MFFSMVLGRNQKAKGTTSADVPLAARALATLLKVCGSSQCHLRHMELACELSSNSHGLDMQSLVL